MSGNAAMSATKDKFMVDRPRYHTVILVNDDHTPRALVRTVLKAETRITEDIGYAYQSVAG